MTAVDHAHAAELRGTSRVLAGFVGVLTATVLIGWAFDVPQLTTLAPGLVSMRVNTALCLALLAIGTVVTANAVRLTAVGLAMGVAVASLLEYVLQTDFGIDQLLATDPAVTDHPGRMAQATTVCLILLGVAQVARGMGSRWLAQTSAVLAFLIGWLALLGYLYGVEGLYAVLAYSTMALHTAAAVIALALAVLATVPHGLFWWVVRGVGPGAVVMRRMVPVAGLLLPGLGFGILEGERAGWYGGSFGLALVVTLSCLAVIGTGYVIARSLDAMDRRRVVAEEGLRALNEALVDGRDEAWRKADELTAELEREHARFERALAQVDDLVWTVELGDDQVANLLYASSDGAGLLGGRMPEGIDPVEGITALVHTDDQGAWADFTARLRSGLPAEVEARLVGYDGEVRWVWVRATPRREPGRIFLDGIVTNITQRRRLAETQRAVHEEERRQREKLEELNRMKDEFFATAGHELRTPVAAISGFAQLLVADPDLPPEQTMKYLEIIHRRSMDLEVLVKDLFDLSLMRTGTIRLSPECVDLDGVVASAVDAVGHLAREEGVEIRVGEGNASLTADPGRLRQILNNLLTNAVKFTPRGGRVDVTTEIVDDTVVLKVSDDGLGISPEDLPHLFDRYFRSSAETKRAIPGTGLGLPITKGLVEAHGGTIEVHNRVPRGTTFTVTLPLHSADVRGAMV